jgi:hypothetical protein
LYYVDFLVSDIVEHNFNEWNINIVMSFFDQSSTAKILATHFIFQSQIINTFGLAKVMEIIPFKVLINICVQNLLDTSHLQVNGG